MCGGSLAGKTKKPPDREAGRTRVCGGVRLHDEYYEGSAEGSGGTHRRAVCHRRGLFRNSALTGSRRAPSRHRGVASGLAIVGMQASKRLNAAPSRRAASVRAALCRVGQGWGCGHSRRSPPTTRARPGRSSRQPRVLLDADGPLRGRPATTLVSGLRTGAGDTAGQHTPRPRTGRLGRPPTAQRVETARTAQDRRGTHLLSRHISGPRLEQRWSAKLPTPGSRLQATSSSGLTHIELAGSPFAQSKCPS